MSDIINNMDIGVDAILMSPLIMLRWMNFINTYVIILNHHPNVNFEQLKKAYDIAIEAHEGQLRKSGEPYIIHPLRWYYSCVLRTWIKKVL